MWNGGTGLSFNFAFLIKSLLLAKKIKNLFCKYNYDLKDVNLLRV